MVDYTADTAARQQDDLDRMAARSLSSPRSKAQPRQGQKARSIWPWMIGAGLLLLIMGMIGSPWFERQIRGQLPEALQAEQPIAQDPRVDALLARVERLEAQPSAGLVAPAAGQPENMVPIFGRLAALEAQAAAFQSSDASMVARLEQLAMDLQRTSGNAEAGDRQVRDLFLVSVARRMVESGRPLGPVQSALSARFSAQDAAAIDSLERWSNVPQTRESLGARLETLGDAIVAPTHADAPGFWGRLMARMSGLVTVRDGTVAGPAQTDALAAARDALAGDDIALAATRLQAAPPSAMRDQWIADARALLAAEMALDRLETMLLDAAAADAAALASAIVPPPVIVAPTVSADPRALPAIP